MMHHEAQMKTYNLGIIGAGMYGQVLMRYFQQDERVNITWVNSASEAHGDLIQDFGGINLEVWHEET